MTKLNKPRNRKKTKIKRIEYKINDEIERTHKEIINLVKLFFSLF